METPGHSQVWGDGLSGGACAGGSGGSCFCTNRLRLCHAATNGRPHPHRSARALGAGGGAGHGRCCALRPSSSRRSAILQRCDAAAGLAASRRRHEEGLSPAALGSWTVIRSLIHPFSDQLQRPSGSTVGEQGDCAIWKPERVACLSRGSAATRAAEWLESAESERSGSTLLFPT